MSKRTDLALSEKVDLLNKINRQPPGTSHHHLAELFCVPKSTIGRLIRQEREIREKHSDEKAQRTRPGKRKRCGKDPEVEEALNHWFNAVLAKGVRISGPILKMKAEEFSHKLGRPDFVATDGWLSRWKARHLIKFKHAHGEKSSADAEAAEEWMSTVLPQLLNEYDPEDIYNADETGLYYRATPDGSLCYAYEQLSGSKKAMDRITVLCYANMTGKDKVKLLVIGKSKKPRCFKGVCMDTLPVTYRANKNAWMTSVLLEEWITKWDAALRKKGRKILVLVDNCSAHPQDISTLTNIRLQFLPANTTSLIQPMDQGVIKNMKTFYRKQLVQMTIDAIEDNLISPSARATDVSSKVSMLDAVRFVSNSWRRVQAETIANCLRKGGFKQPETTSRADEATGGEPPGQEEQLVPEEESALPEVTNGDSYLHIYDDAPCFTDEDSYDDDDIMEEVVSKRARVEESLAAEDDDEEDGEPMVTHAAARHSVQLLQRYFVEQGFDDNAHASLDACTDLVYSRAPLAPSKLL